MSLISKRSAAIKLTRQELVFMCAASGAKKIFGMKGRPYQVADLENSWPDVKESLSQKGFAKPDGEALRIRRDMAQLIQCIADTKIFLVCTKNKGDYQDYQNYYFSNGNVTKLFQDSGYNNYDENYYASLVSDPVSLQYEIASYLELPERDFLSERFSCEIKEDKLTELLKAAEEKNEEEVRKVLNEEGFHSEYTNDFCNALVQKDYFYSIVTQKIHNQTETFVCEVLIFAIHNYVWQIEVSKRNASISIISKYEYLERIGHLAFLCNYY